jgi:hypothetical protein
VNILATTEPQLNSLTHQPTALHHTVNFPAGLVSSLYSLKVDPTENTASNNYFSVVMIGCVTKDWISFPRERIYQAVIKQSIFLLTFVA